MPTAERNVQTVHTFLQLLEDRDLDSWMELWADDADHYYPFGTTMFPRHLVGKAAIYDRWRGMPAMFRVLSFPVQEVWSQGNTVIAKFESKCVLKRESRPYLNNYIGIFKFDERGKIAEYWEYFDPIVAGTEFGLAAVAYAPSGR